MACKHITKRPVFQKCLNQWRPILKSSLDFKEPSVGRKGSEVIYICGLLSYSESLLLKVIQRN